MKTDITTENSPAKWTNQPFLYFSMGPFVGSHPAPFRTAPRVQEVKVMAQCLREKSLRGQDLPLGCRDGEPGGLCHKPVMWTKDVGMTLDDVR